VQFCGCLNDSILKNALIILITYKLSSKLGQSSQTLVLFANTIFTLPFILFASIAGQLADKYERTTIVKIIKLFEVIIVIFASFGFLHENITILFLCICLMGIHSTFFGPIKYSVLPDHLHKNELLGANGFVEAGTFISILIGTIIGGFYNFSNSLIIIISIAVSLVGLFSTKFLPKSNNTNPNLKIKFNLIHDTIEIIKYTHAKKRLYLSILGISWFWFIAVAIISEIPFLTKDVLGADENVANMFLAVFSVGVGMGSFCCGKIFKNEVTTKYVFLASLGISLVGIDLFFASRISEVNYEPEQLKSIIVFLSKLHNWRIVIDLFFFAAIGGLYIVPLFAIMQHYSPPSHRSRVIAVNNLINSIFMAGSTTILSLLFYLGYSVPFVILLISILNMVVAIHIFQLIPETRVLPVKIFRVILKCIFDIMYDVEVKNIENFHKAGKRSVIIANHISYLDPALLAVYLSRNLTFAINTGMSHLSWVKPFLKLAKALPIDSNNAMAIKTLINEVKKNKKIAIFPEGRISLTGSLMKIYEGPGLIADKADATILPVRIDGPQFTHFSKLKNILRTRIFPKVTITILPPVKFRPPDYMNNRMRRKYISQALYDVMVDMMFESSDYKKTLFQSLVESSKIHGFNREIIRDNDGNASSYRELIRRSFALGNVIIKNSNKGGNVGLMLSNNVDAITLFYAMQAYELVPTMINFTSSSTEIISSCKTTCTKIIYTNRKFITKIGIEQIIKAIESANIKVCYIEDLEGDITRFIKLKSLIGSFFPETYYSQICCNHNDTDPSVILFKKEENNKTKTIVLSHRNIQANKSQLLAKVDFNSHDLAFNAMEIYSCLGLTSAILMLANGTPTFFYHSAWHYRIIPEVIYDIGATIMFSTDEFLNLYGEHAHPYDFYSMRYVFAGGEPVKKITRQLWSDKYGIRIFQGYWGAEVSGIIATNTPMHDNPGTVGRLMPKIEYLIQPLDVTKDNYHEDVFEEDIANDTSDKSPIEAEHCKESIGRLFIKGPNIMLGTMDLENPGVINYTKTEHLGDGWYDTGDTVKIDEEGYITILDHRK